MELSCTESLKEPKWSSLSQPLLSLIFDCLLLLGPSFTGGWKDAHVDIVTEGQATHDPPSLTRARSAIQGGFTQVGINPMTAISLVLILVAKTHLSIACHRAFSVTQVFCMG